MKFNKQTSKGLILVLICCILICSYGLAESSSIKSQLYLTYCGNVTIRASNIEQDWHKIKQCEIIEGNLRVHRCKLPRQASLSHLVQVTGYIILERLEGLHSLSNLLPRLAVIRGQSLFQNAYSLVLDANLELEEIGPWSMTNIMRGSVLVQDNVLFCTDQDLQWKNIIHTQFRSGNVFKNNRDFCPFVGCEEEGLCKVRPKSCSATGLRCPQSVSKCSSRCLGGCYSVNDHSSCVACRSYDLDGKCVKKCPQTHLKYLDYRCVSAEFCLNNNGTVFKPQNTTESNLECVKDCSQKFISLKTHREFENYGEIRTCEPRPICETSTLHNRDLGDSLRSCTEINGNLIIGVSEGRNVSRRLEENLGAIKVVTGYVMVVGANALYSLSFLTSLTTILGKEKVHAGVSSNEGYAMYILENKNMREFWGLGPRDLKIKGSIFVSYNDQLCPAEVDKLREAVGAREKDVTAKFNGRKAQCEIFRSSLSAVSGVNRGSMLLTWMHTYCGVDNRYVIGYEVFYRPTDDFVSFYHQRDACNDRDLWSRELLKIPASRNDTGCMTYEVTNLIPNKRYAFYVHSLVADDIKSTIQSNIAYNVTSSIHPRRPKEGKTSLTENSLHVSWKNSQSPYSSPSQIFYEVLVSIRNDSIGANAQFSTHCLTSKGGLSEDDAMEEEHEVNLEDSLGQCMCEDDPFYIEMLKSQRKKNIELEKEVSRMLFKRKPMSEFISSRLHKNSSVISFPQYNGRPNYRKEACRRKFSMPNDCPTPTPEFSKSTMRFSSLFEETSWSESADGNILQWVGRTKGQAMSIHYPLSVDFKDRPKRIDVKVRACLGELNPCSPLNSSGPCALCSHFHKWTKHQIIYDPWDFEVTPQLFSRDGFEDISDQTEVHCPSASLGESVAPFVTKLWAPLEGEPYGEQRPSSEYQEALNFSDSSLSHPNYSFHENVKMENALLKLTWSLSPHLEPVTLGYRILYREITGGAKNAVTQVCLPKELADSQSNILLLPISHGSSYQVGIQIHTTAGYGPIYEKCIYIPWDRQTELLVYLGCGVAVSLIALLAVVFCFLSHKRRNIRGETQNKYYGVTWLEYIHSRFHLAPNQLHVNLDNLLGGGEFGTVYGGTVLKDNGCKTRVAVKTIKESGEQRESDLLLDQSREDRIQALLKEAVIMQDFDSFFIVQLEGVAEEAVGLPSDRETSLYVAMEFMEGGDLKSYLNYRKESKEHLNQQEMIEMAIQVADGMAYLSSRNFQHRDLAARNCMISRESQQRIVKIGDFGLTRYLKEDYYYFPKQNKPLPVRWMAPETLSSVFSDGKYSFWSDVWSFGVLLFEIATTGDKPYERYSNQEVLEKVPSGDLVLRYPEEQSALLSSLMVQCFERTPRERPSFISLVASFLPDTTEQFYCWFKGKSFFHSSKSFTSGDTDVGCDEGFFAGSSIDASQDDCINPTSNLEKLYRLRVRRNRNNNNYNQDKSSTEEDICLTPRAADSCWTLSCAPRRLQEGRRFSFSSDALL